MNTAQIYAQAINPHADSRTDEEKLQQEKEEQRIATNKLEEAIEHNSWLQHKVTKKMFSELKGRRDELNKIAIERATTYHQHNNHQQIIGLLITVDSIDKILEVYARPN